jgi:hypothetical protein
MELYLCATPKVQQDQATTDQHHHGSNKEFDVKLIEPEFCFIDIRLQSRA